MLTYYIFLALAIGAYAIYQKHYGNRFFLAIAALILILFAGLRDASVGTDTGAYTRGYANMKIEEDEEGLNIVYDKDDPMAPPEMEGESFWEKIQDEPGFYYLKLLGLTISDNYAALLTLVALVVTCCFLGSLRMVSQNELVSLFVFITLGLYTFSFNAERQGIAVAIYSLSFPFLIKKKLLPYCGIVLLAALFHKTIIIALPLYFLFTMKFSWKSALMIIVGVAVVTALMPRLIDYGTSLEDRYQLYVITDETAGRGLGLTAFYALLTVFFVWQRQYIDERLLCRYDVFLHMMICASIIFLVVSAMGLYVEVNRFAAYFQIAAIFLWAELFANPKRKLRWDIIAIFIIGHLIYFYIFTDRMAGLTPFEWNTTLFAADSPFVPQ